MRNFLFIPGNSPKMLSGGSFMGSEAVIIDLEDAVAQGEKDAARILVRNAILALRYSVRFGVRINSLDTAHWTADLEEILPCRPDVIMLPKTCCGADVKTLTNEMERIETERGIEKKASVIALIETAAGIENAYSIAGADGRVEALFLGAEDLTADLRAKRTKEGAEILYARSRLVSAARAADIDAYDTPFTDIRDEEGLRSDSAFARQLGFTGKAAINPCQIRIINEAFCPTYEEISYAREVLEAVRAAEAEGTGAVSLHGKMIDAPIVERAKQVLFTAGEKI